MKTIKLKVVVPDYATKKTLKKLINAFTAGNSIVINDTFKKFWSNNKPLPTKWEDLTDITGYYIDTFSDIDDIIPSKPVDNVKNTFPTKRLAKANLALSQLLMLRNAYRDSYSKGWKPDYTDNIVYISRIRFDGNVWGAYTSNLVIPTIFSFPTKELAEKFLNAFKDNLLKEVIPLFTD